MPTAKPPPRRAHVSAVAERKPRYPSDLSNAQWQVIAPLLPVPLSPPPVRQGIKRPGHDRYVAAVGGQVQACDGSVRGLAPRGQAILPIMPSRNGAKPCWDHRYAETRRLTSAPWEAYVRGTRRRRGGCAVEALAGLVISIVAPYIAKGAEAFAQEAGAAAFRSVRAVADRLRSWWSREPVAAAAVESLPSEPGKYSAILTQLLSSDLADDEAFATELRALIERVGPNVQVVQQMEVAKGVTGADIEQLVKGEVHVKQEMKQAENVTGFKAKRVGG